MKRSITLLLTLVMLLTTVVTASAATPVLTDVVGEKCEAAVNVLAGLGIVEGREEGKYEPNGSLTRAEMATIILRAMNMEEGAQGQAIFEDVPASHWAYANVAAAYQLGIINGMSATIFAPDAPVTDEQAVKMVVAALGYGVQAEAAGGYPSGYLSKAAQLDILKNIKVEGEMNRGDMAILLYNALNTQLSIQSSYGDAKLEFSEDEDVTLLTYYLKAQHYTEVINATPMGCVIAAAPSLRSDELVAGTTVMMAGESNAQEFLGQRVEIYAREDELTGKPVVLAIVPRATTDVLDVTAQAIEAAEVSLAEGVFAYENEDGKVVEEDITGAVVVKNGRKIAAPTDADILPAIGAVRLIRNTGKAYQYIIVEEYVNQLVKTVNERTNRVVFEDGTGLTLDVEDKTKAIVITDAEGEAVELGDLEEWNVLSIASSADGNVIRVRVSTEIIEGTVRETRDGFATIDDKEYAVADTVLSGTVATGATGEFYLDCTGAIVATKATLNEVVAGGAEIGDLTYGWLKDFVPEVKGTRTTYYMEIFNSDGEWVTLKLDEKVKFNSNTATLAEDIMDAANAESDLWGVGNKPTLVNRAGEIVPQLIVYKEGKEGFITEIKTAENLTANNLSDEIRTDSSNFSMDWYINSANSAKSSGQVSTFTGTHTGTGASGITQYMGGTVFGRVYISEAIMFVVPEDLSDEKGYEVMKATSGIKNVDELREKACLSFYDVNEDFQTGAVVWRRDLLGQKDGGGVTTKAPVDTGFFALVTGIGSMRDEEGEVYDVIKVFSTDGEKSIIVTEDSQLFYHKANADALSDPDWYGLAGNGERIEGDDRDSIFNARSTQRPTMYLDPQDLDAGDVISYKSNGKGELTVGRVDFRVNYSEYVVMEGEEEVIYRMGFRTTQYGDYIDALTKEALYTSDPSMLFGTVQRLGSSGYTIETVIGKSKTGFLPADPGSAANTGIYSVGGGVCVEWNTRTKKFDTISVGDLEVDDVILLLVNGDLKTQMTIKYTDGRNR